MRRLSLVVLLALVLQAPQAVQAQQPAPVPDAGMPMSEILTWTAFGIVVAATVAWAAWPALAVGGETAAVGSAGVGRAMAATITGAGEGVSATAAGVGTAARTGATAMMDGAGAMMTGARNAAARGWQSMSAMVGRGAAAAP